MKRSNQKGVALIFALIFVLVLSITAAALMFLSQSETFASMNYRMMTQSRYGAEAGLHAAANYLMNNYPQPGIAASDPLNAYNLGVSPITLTAGQTPIVLGPTMNGLAPNYPVGGTLTAFNTATQQSLTAGNNTVNYSVNAELLSMKQVRECQNLQPLTAQLWRLTSHGDINGARNAEVEVSALLESHVVPCYNYAGFATGSGCGSISFNGGGTIDSYNSANMALSGGSPVTQSYEGNLGSNGNVNTAAGTVINGTFSSPDSGVGACGAGAGVDALSGGGTVTGCTSDTTCIPPPGLVKLPQTVTMVTPVIPAVVPAPATNLGNGNAPITLVPCAANCPQNGNNNGNYGDITVSGGTNNIVTFVPAILAGGACAPGTYYVNSISLAGNASIAVGPCPGTGPGTGNPAVYQPVIINVVGAGQATPLNIGGNGIANNTFNSTMLQIQYAGNGAINLHGNGSSTAVLYAPNAGITFSGNANWYGSVIGKTILSNGGASVSIHYDRALQANLATVGNWTMDSFTWSKF